MQDPRERHDHSPKAELGLGPPAGRRPPWRRSLALIVVVLAALLALWGLIA
jgi:hypothetical protein